MMEHRLDLEALGEAIAALLAGQGLPAEAFDLFFDLASEKFESIALNWAHYQYTPVKPEARQSLEWHEFAESLYRLLESFDLRLKKYGFTLFLPEDIFETLAARFADRRDLPDRLYESSAYQGVAWNIQIIKRRK